VLDAGLRCLTLLCRLHRPSWIPHTRVHCTWSWMQMIVQPWTWPPICFGRVRVFRMTHMEPRHYAGARSVVTLSYLPELPPNRTYFMPESSSFCRACRSMMKRGTGSAGSGCTVCRLFGSDAGTVRFLSRPLYPVPSVASTVFFGV
jgi:hypothetical protein